MKWKHVRLAILFSVVTVASAHCVCLSTGSLGDECDDSSTCGNDLVCILLDESVSNGPRVCVPMKSVDAPQPCTEARDCAAAAWPVDATCVDGECACVGDTFTFTCLPGNILASATCACITEPDDFDAGPIDDDDAGAGEGEGEGEGEGDVDAGE